MPIIKTLLAAAILSLASISANAVEHKRYNKSDAWDSKVQTPLTRNETERFIM